MTTGSSSWSVVLCEGYDDRAFWKGWLRRLGCRDARGPSGEAPVGPGGVQVRGGGRYAYYTAKGALVVVHPVGGRSRIAAELALRLARHATRPLRHLVVNIDSDTEEEQKSGATTPDQYLTGLASSHGFAPCRGQARRWTKGDISLGGAVWETTDPIAAGVPPKQTLERLICTAIVRAYPDSECGCSLEQWLAEKPVKLGQGRNTKDHKQRLWSFFGKWFVDAGTDHFFDAVWDDEAIAAELERQLKGSASWDVAAELAALSR